jgi:hypothetical protein
MKPFTVEGSVCFANVPPGLRVKMERYDMHPDGTVRWALTIAPELPRQELQDADIDEVNENMQMRVCIKYTPQIRRI